MKSLLYAGIALAVLIILAFICFSEPEMKRETKTMCIDANVYSKNFGEQVDCGCDDCDK